MLSNLTKFPELRRGRAGICSKVLQLQSPYGSHDSHAQASLHLALLSTLSLQSFYRCSRQGDSRGGLVLNGLWENRTVYVTRNPWNISHSESSGIMGMCKGKKCYAQKVQGSLNSLFVYKSFYSLGFKRKKSLDSLCFEEFTSLLLTFQ